MFTRHAHRAADLYAPLPTTGPVRVVLPDSEDPDAGLASITPAALLTAWLEVANGFRPQQQP
jgi:hypothetical protein